MRFALAGNQNCGKTTLFNALTGSNQHVGNFPGVTVEQKVGDIKGQKNCTVVDLPGIYSLRPYTQEEIVTRDYIINEKPDGIINIVDATNIERNLYLTLQLLELRVPMVLALNMMDEVRANGGTIDVKMMSDALGIPVIPVSAAKGEGISDLIDKAVETARNKTKPVVTDFCSDDSAVHSRSAFQTPRSVPPAAISPRPRFWFRKAGSPHASVRLSRRAFPRVHPLLRRAEIRRRPRPRAAKALCPLSAARRARPAQARLSGCCKIWYHLHI